jgi:TonB family protein
MVALYYHSAELPWTTPEEERRRYRKILLWVLLSALILALIVPFLPVTEQPDEQVVEVPPRLARLILERKQPPPPPPPPKVEEKKPEPKPEPEKKVEKKPEPKPEPKKQPEPKPEVKTVEKAREKAKSVGVLAFADELADLRDTTEIKKLSRNVKPGTAGSQANKTQRSLVTSNLGTASAGIATGSLSRDTGGTQIAQRTTTKVKSQTAAAEQERQNKNRSRGGSRTHEDIQRVFDRDKSKIFRIYQRALRQDPALQGKVVLKLTIEPSGQVTLCEIVSSELGSPDLERKIVQRVKLFNFGAAEVQTVTVTYPIEFFPA